MSSYLENNKKVNCCGCQACKNICPKQCITMEYDNEGFVYPKVDLDKCIKCKLCVNVCPYNTESHELNLEKQRFYAGKNKDESIRGKSSSGGIFVPLSNIVLNEKGIIFGAKFNKEFTVYHAKADTTEERDKFCQSKYMQSDIGSAFKEVKKELLDGKKVLFSGSPCQVSGLLNFLGKSYENLLTVDFVCHGVPSSKVFRSHLDYLEKKFKSKVTGVNFRTKKEHLGTQNLEICFDNNRKYFKYGQKDYYYYLFEKDIILRPSCYECMYSKTSRVSDITIGDFWGIDYVLPKFNDGEGVSLVIINSENGRKHFDLIKSNLEIYECTIEDAKNRQPCLEYPVKYNDKRKKFFYMYNLFGYKVSCIYGVLIQKIIQRILKV